MAWAQSAQPCSKGGWGPDPDGKYLVRQMGLLKTSSGYRAAVAITARPPDGTYASGQVLLSQVASWLKANIGRHRRHAIASVLDRV